MAAELRCSFCAKSESQVRKLVAGGGGGYICDACVSIAARIIEDSDASSGTTGRWRRLLFRARDLVRRRSRPTQTELRVGVPFPTVAMEILRHSVDNARLQAMLLSGDTVPAGEALRLGFVDQLSDADRLLERAVARASTLASVPSRSYELSKRQLRAPALARIDARTGEDDVAVREAWMDPATHRHMREYLEKTIGKSA